MPRGLLFVYHKNILHVKFHSSRNGKTFLFIPTDCLDHMDSNQTMYTTLDDIKLPNNIVQYDFDATLCHVVITTVQY